MARLDTRRALMGEKRLTDPQVRALKDAADHGLHHVRSGWGTISQSHGNGTILALRRLDFVKVDEDRVVATARGREILRRIDLGVKMDKVGGRP